jgi:hypothetical protein
MAPLAALAAMAGSPHATHDEIIDAIARKFPDSTRESARAGARAGFEARHIGADNDRSAIEQNTPTRRILKEIQLDPERHAPRGNTLHYMGSDLYEGGFSGLRIAQYENDDAYFLLYLTPDGNELTESWHQTLNDALNQAEDEFFVQRHEWLDAD